jgi:hypothetical protein
MSGKAVRSGGQGSNPAPEPDTGRPTVSSNSLPR